MKMTPEQFVYWLQGWLELSESPTLSETQVQVVKDHIAQVLTKTTPDRPGFPAQARIPAVFHPETKIC
jgi:hypothetical protein